MAGSKSIGPWALQEILGRGGNADVWRATSADGREVALKVLHTRKAQKEPYRRFVREIELLRRLPDLTGLLPLIDSYLPESPSETEPPWLAMPIAIPIADALTGQPLDAVVSAMTAVAQTMSRLHGEYGLAHRDLKPSNLYSLDGACVVGDFGLVAVPDVKELTRTGRPIGPAHFTPYELIADPTGSDPKAADVYSLAKTLWVLATEQRFPPEGHQPANTRRFSINDYRPHPNAFLLDQVIDLGTRIHPEARPTMAKVAADLERWLRLPPETRVVEIGDVRTQLRQRLELQLAAEDLAEQRRELAHAAVRRLTGLVEPLNQALRDLHPRATIDGEADEFTRNVVRTIEHSGSPEIAFRYQRLSEIAVDPRGLSYELRFGRTIELVADGTLILHMFVDVGYETLGGRTFSWGPVAWSAAVGSVEADEMMRAAVHEAAAQFVSAAKTFAEGVPPTVP